MKDLEISPPDYTRSDENCRFRTDDRECCNVLNYLRPHKCNGYCVAKLDRWLRRKYPELDEESITSIVAKLARHDAQ